MRRRGALFVLGLALSLQTVVHADYLEGMDDYRRAWAAYAAQQYAEAGRWVAQAIQADPANPYAHALAGDLAYLAHDLHRAQVAWQRALTLDPRLRVLQDRLAQVAQEHAFDTGQQMRADELFVLSTPIADTDQRAALLHELHAAQRVIEEHLQCRLQGPITVLVYAPEVFYDGLHVPTAVAGLFDGKVRLPVRPAGTAPSMRAVVWHELTHAAVHQLTHGAAPRWLHEGVAQAVQAEVETIPVDALRLAVQQHTVPSLAMLEGRSGTFGEAVTMPSTLFYQAAWLQVDYVIEHRGWAGLRRLLDSVGRGTSATEALTQMMQMSEADWDRQWQRWVSDSLDVEAPRAKSQ